MGRIKNYKKRCANPFQKHKKVYTSESGLRKVPAWILEKKFYPELSSDSLLCTNCRVALNKTAKEKADQDECSFSESSCSSEDTSDTDENSGDEDYQPDISEKEKKSILKKMKFEDALEKKTNKLNEQKWKVAGWLRFKNTILVQLKEEFARTDSYVRRLQILTISLYDIEETMNYFGASRLLVDKAVKWKSMHGIFPDEGSKLPDSDSDNSQKSPFRGFPAPRSGALQS